MDFGIKERTALVLGAGGGLGGAIAAQLAEEGARVAVADVSGEAAEATARRIDPTGRRVMTLAWDLGDLEIVPEKLAALEAKFGTVDILVNNSGGPPPTPVAGQSASVWQEYFNSMALSIINVTDHVLPAMRAQKWGRVITSASSGVVAPIPNLGLSNALRSSLLGWSKTLAREVAPDNVTCNIVVPGRIATARTRSLDASRAEREGRTVEDVARESTSSIPMGRYGEPREYANAVAFLASEPASYITGSVVRVDGGVIQSV